MRFSTISAIRLAKFAVLSSLLIGGGAIAPVVYSQDQAATSQADKEPARKEVGKIRSSTGLVSVQGVSGKNKFASAGTKLYVGDIINTQNKSTAVLEFIDTSQVALRPESRFVVEDFQFQADNPVADKAEFKLLKGGVRALTGLISKRGDQDAFKMKGATATIGIRGTDFTLRLCKGDDCGALRKTEKVSATSSNATTSGAAGRVAQVAGDVVAIDKDGKSRPLERSSAVFAGDRLKASEEGFAVIAMADSGRLTLAGGSEMEISAYKYSPEAEKTSVASVKIVTGAVRFITGKIGKADPENVKFVTETATIGIRGTSGSIGCFGVACANIQADTATGMLVLYPPAGPNGAPTALPILIPPGQSGLFGAGGLPQVIVTQQSVVQRHGRPAPEPILPPGTFNQLSTANTPPPSSDDGGEQVLVGVNDGQITVQNQGVESQDKPIIVSRGQGVVITGQIGSTPKVLQAPPRIIVEDNTLSSPDFAPQQCVPN